MNDDPNLYRLRAFELGILQPLRSYLREHGEEVLNATVLAVDTGRVPLDEVGSSILLRALLMAEYRDWIDYGQYWGHFPSDVPYTDEWPAGSNDDFEPDAFERLRYFSQIDGDKMFLSWEFDRAWASAVMDLTPERIEYLRLTLVASQEDWSTRARELITLSEQLHQFPEMTLTDEAIARVSWALSGAESQLTDAVGTPSYWRSGGAAERFSPTSAYRELILEGVRRRLLDAARQSAAWQEPVDLSARQHGASTDSPLAGAFESDASSSVEYTETSQSESGHSTGGFVGELKKTSTEQDQQEELKRQQDEGKGRFNTL